MSSQDKERLLLPVYNSSDIHDEYQEPWEEEEDAVDGY